MAHASAGRPHSHSIALKPCEPCSSLSSWLRFLSPLRTGPSRHSFADQAAEAGYLAVAVDLLSGFDDQHERTSDFATSDDARTALYEIDAPVYGFYGENDQRINATIPDVQARMDEIGKVYHPVIYPGAGHAFMRRGDDPGTASDDPNRAARDAAWERIKMLVQLASLDD